MKFLVDENVPHRLVATLSTAGHDVLDVKSSKYHTSSDKDLLAIAEKESRIIVSYDLDFLSPAHAGEKVGRIIVRIPYPNLEIVINRLFEVLEKYSVSDSLVIIYPDHDEVEKLS